MLSTLKKTITTIAVMFLPLMQLGAIDNFIIVSPPKCGTHFIIKICELMTGKKPFKRFQSPGSLQNFKSIVQEAFKGNQFLVIHELRPRPAIMKYLIENNIKVIFMMRDPRDQTISMTNWITEGNHPYFPIDKLDSFDERLLEMITGEQFGFKACGWGIMPRKNWIYEDQNTVCCCRFENLVGSKGGGDDDLQLKEFSNIAKHLSIPCSYELLQHIAENCYGNTYTFRVGKIARWKRLFKHYHKQAFKKNFGDLLIEWGYENDHNW